MKWASLLCFLFLTGFCGIDAGEKENVIHYRVTRSDYTFSTVFDMALGKTYLGCVVKTPFHLTTHYDAYDRLGVYEGQGICRLFCLGVFYIWGTEIDVYNINGEKVGFIDGQLVSSEPAKFSFYTASGQRAAIAYLDQNSAGFSLIDPNNPARIFARLTRNFIIDAIDNWEVMIYDSERIDPRLVKIFAAFVCDTQNKFKADL